MNLIKYFFVLLLSSLPAIIIFSFGVTLCLAPLALFAKKQNPPLIVAIPFILLAGVFQIYFWGLWSAYCVATTYKFTTRADVSWDWLYFITGFSASYSLIGLLNYKEQRRESFQRQSEIQKGTIYYAALACIAYIVFAIWPSLIIPIYGWATNRLNLTKYISPIEWTQHDRVSSQHFLNTEKATDELWSLMSKIGAPDVPQSNISPEQIKGLLARAISESDLVTEEFLCKTHPDLPVQYAELCKSLRGVSAFLSTGNEKEIETALDQYNRHCVWFKAHFKSFRKID